MCGIVGIFNLKNDKNRIVNDEQLSFMINLFLTEGLLNTEKRGKDATGYYAVFSNSESLGLKNGEKASKFVFDSNDKPELTYSEHMRVLETYHNEVAPIESVIAHCRKSTVGAVNNNNNNHPIAVDDRFAGIHNGTLTNHDIIEAKHKDEINRVGSVDSEMLVQLAKVWTLHNEGPFTIDTCNWIYSKIEGPCVTFIVDKEHPNCIMWIKATRPLVFCYVKEAGLLLAVSELSILDSMKEAYVKLSSIYGMDLPEMNFQTSTVIDNHCGIIDTNIEIDVVDSTTAAFVDNITNDVKLKADKDKDYVLETTNKVGFGTGNYSRNTSFGTGCCNSAANNTNKTAGSLGGGTNNAANNKTSITSDKTTSNKTTSNKSTTNKSETTDSKSKNKSEDDKSDNQSTTCIRTLSFVNGSYVKSWCDKDSIIPKDPKKVETDKPVATKIDDDLEKVMPIKRIYSAKGLDIMLENVLNMSHVSTDRLTTVETCKLVEKACFVKASEVVKELKAKLEKETNSSKKTRKRLLTLKRFLMAILPFINIPDDKVSNSLSALTDDDIDFIKRFLPERLFNKMPEGIKAYVNDKLGNNTIKGNTHYA